MANKTRNHLLTLTRPQLIALATQKGVAEYRNAINKTKGQLIALLCDVEGVLKPVKTWPEIDGEARLDNDPAGIEELAASLSAVTAAAAAFATDITSAQAAAAAVAAVDDAPRHDDTGLQCRRSEYLI